MLAAHGLRPKHRFGQNFLHDGNHMQRILDAASVAPGDVVLEVGPGTGALTERLLETEAQVVAVEIDAAYAPLLHERLAQRQLDANFTLVVADVLAGKHQIEPAVIEAVSNIFRTTQKKHQGSQGSRGFKLIANLPYNVASPLLVNLAMLTGTAPTMTHAVVMLQKEVAGRITAPHGGKDYGPLGIILQSLYEARTVGTLSPNCFWPAPKVASAVVALRRREQPLTDAPPEFAAFVHRLFTARRKQLRGILGPGTPLPPGIEPTQRPETLSLEQIVALHRLPPSTPPKPA